MGLFDNGKVKANFIFEMLGRPKEHLEATMADFVKQLENEEGIKITNKTIHPAKLMEPQKDKEGKLLAVQQELYTTFAEVEVDAKTIMDVSMLVFKYLPAHVEVISPENIEISNVDFNAVLNQMTARLHQYDSIAKTALMHNQMLAKKFLELKEGKKEMNILNEKKEPTKIEEEKKPEDKPAKKSKKKKEDKAE